MHLLAARWQFYEVDGGVTGLSCLHCVYSILCTSHTVDTPEIIGHLVNQDA